MAKQIIRLTESDLHRIIKESVERIINEGANVDYKEEYIGLSQDELSALKEKLAEKLRTPAGKINIELKRRYQAVKELLGANVIKGADPYWSAEKNKELGKYTYEDWKQMNPRERSKVKNPKFQEIDKGRSEIAADALRREKELKAIEQGAVDTD